MADAEGSMDSFEIDQLQYNSPKIAMPRGADVTGFGGDPTELGSKDPKRFNNGLEKI